MVVTYGRDVNENMETNRGDAQSGQGEEEREGESLRLKIKAQLEDLLSDSHLAEDSFLLNTVQRSKGNVSLKLLHCLKPIKALNATLDVTLAAALCSELLEVNDKRTKVRRIEPFPNWLLRSPTNKSLLAWNISVDETTGENGGQDPSLLLEERILQKFSAHGRVTSVCILYPGKELPKEVQRYAKCHKELGQQLCAVVKFNNLGEVRKAYNALKAEEEQSNGEGMHVVPLRSRPMHHIAKDEENNEDRPGDTPSQENPVETSEDSVQKESSASVQVSDEPPDRSLPQKSLDHSMQSAFKQISISCSHQPFSGWSQRYSEEKSWCSRDRDMETSQCPWVLRRKHAASALNSIVAQRGKAPHLMQRVLRQPIGPDGTKGFHSRRKPLLLEEL